MMPAEEEQTIPRGPLQYEAMSKYELFMLAKWYEARAEAFMTVIQHMLVDAPSEYKITMDKQ